MPETERIRRTRAARTTAPRPARAVAPLAGGLAHAAWLSERLLLASVWFELPARRERLAWELELLDGATDGPPALLALAPESAEPPALGQLLALARIDRPEASRESAPGLRLTLGSGTLELSGEDVAAALVDMRTLVRESLAGLDASMRERIVPWLAGAAALHGEDEGAYALGRTLHAARESLRERGAPALVAPDEARGLQVETLLEVDPATYWVKGWARDVDARVSGLAAISPEGSRGDLLGSALRLARPDVEQFYAAATPGTGEQRSGFVGLAELDAPSRLGDGWLVELQDTMGASIEAQAPAPVRDPLAVRDAILADFALARRPEDPARAALFEPALTRIQARLAAAVEVDHIRAHGHAPHDPEVSIVVPLYGRIDFVEHQLTQFARDPELRQADLIYVLDSPEHADALERLAPELHALTGVPLRVVTLACNAGFSGANNIGAALARGRKLLLLNSDVLPDRPGWLGTMAAFFDATPGIGALAPKLLYEDDSLQHAGMYFLRAPGASHWENMHYFKGMSRATPAANVARRVPAVTGACMMVDRERYRALGGLRGQFVQGDYEDSDLCLRLGEAGLDTWYLPDAELYHLEAQSYPGELRRATSAYNTWLHSHLWSDRIADVMNAEQELAA